MNPREIISLYFQTYLLSVDYSIFESLEFCTNSLKKMFRSDEQEKVTGSMKYLNLVSPKRFDILLKALLAVIASLLLLVPVILLFKLQPTQPSQVKGFRSWGQIFVVFFFTLAFSAACSIFTKARKQEVFTATAAYSAVLVVFLGNTSQMLACSNNGS